MSERPRCAGTTVDGSPCRSTAVAESGFCISHDPERREEMRAARSKGARATNRMRRHRGRGKNVRTADPSEVPDRPKTIEDAIEWASWAVWAVATGEIDARTGHEVGYVLRAFLDGRKHADDVDDRVKELKAKMDELREASA